MKYITLLASDDYLDGVIVLKKCLLNTNCKHELVVCITNTLSHNTLQVLDSHMLKTIRVDKLECKNVPFKNKWRLTYTKLHLFGLTQFDKLVYIDADMVILENIDHLFDLPHMSAVSAGNWSSIKNEKYCLNSGLMVLIPNEKDYKCLLYVASENNKFLNDQDIINSYFSNWYKNENLHLDLKYNIFVNQIQYIKGKYHLNGFNNDDKNLPAVAVLHYISPKPWVTKDFHLISNKAMFLYKLWQDIKMT